ncbi:hypothetical protein [Chryseobacterium oncorhynchi]|uniref:Uncharacterized protein n=1 Tax=Chryseobacterium oncorhynchi TaxID=741074 RepID=A0A316WL14_9FLAO|nr:hypothetical protein [Chryseobacterium oncorhynchi]PWN62122.1 hypothetical protein C1638_016575 [Chryseobacterium oncorhynchi]
MKNILPAILLLFSIQSYAQIEDIQRNYQTTRERARDYYSEVNKPNQYFHYRIKDGKEDYYLYLDKKKYDSLLVLKSAEPTIIKNSNVYSKADKGYYIIKDNIDQKRRYFLHYDKEIITQEILDDNYNIYNKTDYKTLVIESYYFGNENYSFLYQYEKFNKNTFNPFTDLIYKKVIYQDKSIKIFNYERDFPLPDEAFLKKVPEIFRQQSFELLKANGKIKTLNDKVVQGVSLDIAKAINNGNYFLYKVYRNNDETKPVYKIIMDITKSNWTIEINPKNEKIEFLDVDLSRI